MATSLDYVPEVRLFAFWPKISAATQLTMLHALTQQPDFIVSVVFNVSWGPNCNPVERCLKRYLERDSSQIFVVDQSGRAVHTRFVAYKGTGHFTVLSFVDIGAGSADKQLARFHEVCSGLNMIAGVAELVTCTSNPQKAERDLQYLLAVRKDNIVRVTASGSIEITRWDGVMRSVVNNGHALQGNPISMQYQSIVPNRDAIEPISPHEVFAVINDGQGVVINCLFGVAHGRTLAIQSRCNIDCVHG
eukprot:TRINITY_DN7451_c0_g1_i2.p1 TRINITY_DN7451_c0_g1~~TRINITY_DN7451_c0_g1_i2.p1  ORF type:complete len:289 (+),score=9.98 TRINITY_DN7451_c0_g1_i2:129-869(+)